jgi:hypothetical protein
LADLPLGERASALWEAKSVGDRASAEQVARTLAQRILGVREIEFDNFVSDAWARRRRYSPFQTVTFAVEGLEFNYAQDSNGRHELWLIDRCPFCEEGVRLLGLVNDLSDLGRLLSLDFERVRCRTCREDSDERIRAYLDSPRQVVVDG